MTLEKEENCRDCGSTLEIYEIDFKKNRQVKKCPKCGLYYFYKKDILGNWSLKKVVKPDFSALEEDKYKLIGEIVEKFKFLGVDEDWIAVLISTNLIEQAMKKKLEDLGVVLEKKPPPSFKDIRKALGEALREKENWRLDSLFEPKELWRIRSKMDHWGYKLKFNKDKARAIFVMAKEIIDEIWQGQ